MAEHCQKVMYIHCLTHTWWHLITAAWPTGFNHANILHGISLWMAEILDRFMTDDSMLTMFSILHMFVKSRFWSSSPNILVFPFLSFFIYHFMSFLLVVLHSTSYLVFFCCSPIIHYSKLVDITFCVWHDRQKNCTVYTDKNEKSWRSRQKPK